MAYRAGVQALVLSDSPSLSDGVRAAARRVMHTPAWTGARWIQVRYRAMTDTAVFAHYLRASHQTLVIAHRARDMAVRFRGTPNKHGCVGAALVEYGVWSRSYGRLPYVRVMGVLPAAEWSRADEADVVIVNARSLGERDAGTTLSLSEVDDAIEPDLVVVCDADRVPPTVCDALTQHFAPRGTRMLFLATEPADIALYGLTRIDA
jgi:hypothetical protein